MEISTPKDPSAPLTLALTKLLEEPLEVPVPVEVAEPELNALLVDTIPPWLTIARGISFGVPCNLRGAM
jgi:hypothetical protein